MGRATPAPALAALAALVAAVLVAFALGSTAAAQTPEATPAPPAAPAAPAPGTIRGAVTMGTAGHTLDPDVQVEVIILDGGTVAGTASSAVVDGEYAVAVAALPTQTYIPRVVYQGVPYFAEPAALTAESPEAVRDFEVYATTSERPDLAISLTVVTVVALDREAGQLGIVREDLVANPSDRVFSGGEGGTTVRIPAPEGTIEAVGENPDGTSTLDSGVVATTTPLHALAQTSIITRFLVEYDPDEDGYLLRVTAPLPTTATVVRVPEGYARNLVPRGEAQMGDPEQFEPQGGEPVSLETVVLRDVAPGEGLLVRLDGFAPVLNRNRLTEQPGAAIAAGAAAVVIGGAAAFSISRRRAGAR